MKYFENKKWGKIRDNTSFVWVDSVDISLFDVTKDILTRQFDNLDSMYEYCSKYGFYVIYDNKFRKSTFIHPLNGLINYTIKGVYSSTYAAGYLLYDKILCAKKDKATELRCLVQNLEESGKIVDFGTMLNPNDRYADLVHFQIGTKEQFAKAEQTRLYQRDLERCVLLNEEQIEYTAKTITDMI